jgi:hypothetical protein
VKQVNNLTEFGDGDSSARKSRRICRVSEKLAFSAFIFAFLAQFDLISTFRPPIPFPFDR